MHAAMASMTSVCSHISRSAAVDTHTLTQADHQGPHQCLRCECAHRLRQERNRYHTTFFFFFLTFPSLLLLTYFFSPLRRTSGDRPIIYTTRTPDQLMRQEREHQRKRCSAGLPHIHSLHNEFFPIPVFTHLSFSLLSSSFFFFSLTQNVTTISFMKKALTTM